jgi:hypothetical protein
MSTVVLGILLFPEKEIYLAVFTHIMSTKMEVAIKEKLKSKADKIRSKNLRNFLWLYYYAHLHTSQEDNPLISKLERYRIESRAPRVFPGLRPIREFLGCSKGAAQDYLRAIYITREIFLATPIERKKYEQLRKDLVPNFEEISKLLFLKQIKPNERAKKMRALLYDSSKQISEQTGFFTPKECAQIIEELAALII